MNKQEIYNIWFEIVQSYGAIPYHFGNSSLELLCNLSDIELSKMHEENQKRGTLYLQHIFEKYQAHNYLPRPAKREYEDYNFIKRFWKVRSTWSLEELRKFNYEMSEVKAIDMKIIRDAKISNILNEKGHLNKKVLTSLGYTEIKSVDRRSVQLKLIDDNSECVGRVLIGWTSSIKPRHYSLGFAICHKNVQDKLADWEWIEILLDSFDFSFYLNRPVMRDTYMNPSQGTALIEIENCSRLAELIVFREIWKRCV